MEKIIEIAIVITGSLPYLLLVIGITKGVIKQSFASWLLWLILDVIVLIGLIVKNGSYLVYLVFTIGTFVVTLFLFLKRNFKWGKFDSFIAILVFICMIVYFSASSYLTIIIGTIALALAGIPQFIDILKDPRSTSTIAYLLFSTSGTLSLFETSAWTVQDKLPQLCSAVFTLTSALFSLRRKGLLKNRHV